MSVRAIVGTEELWLTDGAPYWLEGFQGLGRAPMHVITTRGPEQHGETLLDFRLDPRVFALVLGFAADTYSDWQNARDALLRFLTPFGMGLVLEWLLGDGETRRLDCMCVEDMDMSSGDRQGFYQRVAATFRAADPTFYDPTMGAQSFELGGGGAGFEVPTPVPTAIGGSTIDSTHVIAYPGTAPSSPIIRVTGPITNCIITNLTTGKLLDLTGTTIAAGAYYDIDTRYAHQTVTDNLAVNQIADLTDDSDLGTFQLAPWPVAASGVNSIRVTGSGVTAATQVQVSWYNRYLGI